jgi:hypothetical protein
LNSMTPAGRRSRSNCRSNGWEACHSRNLGRQRSSHPDKGAQCRVSGRPYRRRPRVLSEAGSLWTESFRNRHKISTGPRSDWRYPLITNLALNVIPLRNHESGTHDPQSTFTSFRLRSVDPPTRDLPRPRIEHKVRRLLGCRTGPVVAHGFRHRTPWGTEGI